MWSCEATPSHDAIAQARRAVQEWSEHTQGCRMQRVMAGRMRRSWTASRTLRWTLCLWERATIGYNLARGHAVRQLVVRVLPALKRRTVAGCLGTLRKNASLRRARRLLVGVRIAKRARDLVSEILGQWLRECAVGQLFRSAQEQRTEVRSRHQERSVAKEEFLEWAERAQANTNRFSNLLFAVSCWRQVVSLPPQRTSGTFQQRGAAALHVPEVLDNVRASPDSVMESGVQSSSVGEGEWLGQSSYDDDDLPGMSPRQNDSVDQQWTTSSQGSSRPEVHHDLIWRRGGGGEDESLREGSLITAFLSPVTSELDAGEDEAGLEESGRQLFDWDFRSRTLAQGNGRLQAQKARSVDLELRLTAGQSDERSSDIQGTSNQNESLDYREFVSSLARFSGV